MEGGGPPHEVLHLPRRTPNPLQPPLSNTLIPRDFLSQRSGAQDLHSHDVNLSPHTQPIPLRSTPLPDVEKPPHDITLSKMPSIANPHSPRPLHPKETDEGSPHQQHHPDAPADKRRGTARKEAGRRTHPGQGDNVRNVSAPVPAGLSPSHLIPSPPCSPRSVNSMGKEEQKVARAALPRNSSIDSALSSMSSSAEHSHKSSNDSTNANSPEVQHLIAAAGSAENLIMHLLKDKQHAASQNAQLWKLVDKQRSLLIGLNQDLERAINDKEKYRKKLKDTQTQIQLSQHADLPEQYRTTVEEKTHEPQPLVVEKDGLQTEASLSSPSTKSINGLQPSPLDPSMMPSPLHLVQNQQNAEITTVTESCKVGEDQHRPAAAPDQVLNDRSFSSYGNNTSEQNNHHAAKASFLSSPSPTLGQNVDHKPSSPSTSVDTMSSPVEIAESKSGAQRPVTRKPPPAPLKLGQAKPSSSLLQDVAPVDRSDAAYNKSQSVPERTLSERGRRQTREEDDRDREVVAQQEQQARSRSSKSSKSGKKKSKPDMKAEAPTKVAAVVPPSILPTTSSQVPAPPPPDAAAGGPAPPSSIAAVLSPNSSRAALGAAAERTVTAPPMSPGLPVSPRPVDRPLGSPTPRLPRDGSGIPLSPPMSPSGAASGVPLSPRPPRPPIPLPQAPLVVSSPPPHQEARPQPTSPRRQDMPAPAVTTGSVDESVEGKAPPVSPFHGVHVDRSFMDPAYPNLLLPPNALSSILIKVASSRLRPKRHSYMALKSNDEDPVFTLSIFSRSDGRELWRTEKVIMALPQVDQQMKGVSNFSTKLPERKLFSGHSPATVDARRTALNHYFAEVLEAATDEKSALVVCNFLSNDVIEARDDETSLLSPSQRSKPALALGPDGRPVKEGYLTKRGKNFGGWKVRYFVLQVSELKYFESPGGTHLGTIKLQNAQIGKQTQTPSPSRSEDDVENQYRHAFLVLEPKRKDSSSLVRHVLCAESDHERDEWVLFLTQNVDNQPDDEHNKQQAAIRHAEDGTNHVSDSEAKVNQSSESHSAPAQDDQTAVRKGNDELRGIGYEQMAAGTAPTTSVQQINRRQEATPSPASTSSATNTSYEGGPAHDQHATSHLSKFISGTKNGSVMQEVGSWGNKLLQQTSVKDKKRSMWGFRQRAESDGVQSSQPVPNGGAHNFSQQQNGHAQAVFGLPLAEAVERCPPRGVNVHLPAVVYRCIEYLRAKDAACEEGIFRLSGSNIVIKALRERFNTEGDVDFLADDHYHDVHAVASLFKSYLRELPTTVLTKELHLDFLHVLELDEKSKKIAAFNVLVHRLPRVNVALLRALSQYLIEIVNNADRNKMNVRNMGIVFSPTLNIPAPVFAMFLTDFEAIFGVEPAEMAPAENSSTRTVELSVPNQLTAEDIRSPRRQMFSELPTPAYDQTTFPQGGPPAQFPMQQSLANPPPPSDTNVAHNTGFIPMQPSYETRTYVSDPQAPTQPQQRYSMAAHLAQRVEYGSMNMMMAPSNAGTLKAKRRESSMLFMGAGSRKSTMPKIRDDSGESKMS
jgi:RalA-binding protein 1